MEIHKVISNLTLSTKGEVSAMFGGLSGASIKNITFENVQSKDLGTKYAAISFRASAKNWSRKFYKCTI
jgi:hypothetical protein